MSPQPSTKSVTLIYASAALAGAVLFVSLSLSFPHGFGTYGLVPGGGDLSQALNAILLYREDAWRLPLFTFLHPGTGARESLILGDGIPLLALPLKALAGLDLAPSPWATWRLIACIGQPVAAVWACRAWGIRAPHALFLAALLALLTPAFLHRGATAHLALSAHWPLLVAVGAYAVDRRLPAGRAAVLWAGVIAMALMVHPYMAAMAASLALGAILARALRDGLPAAAFSLVGTATGVSVVVFLGGYAQAAAVTGASGGFGAPSLSADLLAPIHPRISGLFGGLTPAAFQDEGFNYWGAGLLAAVVGGVLVAVRRRERLDLGLVLVCAGLVGYALASPIRLAGTPVVALDGLYEQIGGLEDAFRASGRFWWPVTYVVLVLSVREFARYRVRTTTLAAGVGLAALQLADTAPLLAHWSEVRQGAGVNHPQWQTLLASHERLVTHPDVQCLTGVDARNRLTNITYAATRHGLITTSYPAARSRARCGRHSPAPSPVAGELHLFHAPPADYVAIARARPSLTCQQTPTADGVLYACSRRWPYLPDLSGPHAFTPPGFAPSVSPVADLALAAGDRLGTHAGAPGAEMLRTGWYAPEPWGAWSRHGDVHLLLPTDGREPWPDQLRVRVRAFLTASLPARTVRVRVAGKPAATWRFTTARNEGVRTLPLPTERPDGPLVVTMTVSGHTTPAASGTGSDARSLGIGISWIQPVATNARQAPSPG